ncbi:MAG: hypothetical protein K0S38_398 [Candidatus Paceibacter sp.]|jgi:prepilin-type N-terminal cleavage/methylation domain-containing protein|nr:hypothetical protein [Candidatus Paceibacter sp.]
MARIFNSKKGFTLVELLVVISIISLLSAVVLASLSTAKAKARDAQVKSTFNQVQKALFLYYDKYGRYPNPTAVTNGTDQWFGNFNNMAQQLVSEGFLVSVPVSPDSRTFNYYNYNANNPQGALLKTTLSTYPASMTGAPGSCRPFNNTNWCSSIQSTQDYCICNPH